MEIKILKIEDINPNKYNPRKELSKDDDEYRRIKNSILEFGLVEPFIVNGLNNNLISGHQRLNVLKELGWTEVNCVVENFDEEKEKALNIALNKITGEWDETKLVDLMREFQNENIEIDITGFNSKEIDVLLKKYNETDTNADTSEENEEIIICPKCKRNIKEFEEDGLEDCED